MSRASSDREADAVFPLRGFAAELGIRIADWTDGIPHLALDLRPEFLNRNGAVHGGVIMTLLDSACSVSGCRYVDGAIVGRVVAVSITVNFIAPATSGTLHARARLRGGGSKLLMTEGEVTDDDGRLIATASGVVRRIEEGAR
jgi:uncharacterized protein (TIGR00369 family)